MFEENMKELEEIIAKLESGNVGFDDASKLYERGAEICKTLSKQFEEIKGKVTVIREGLNGLFEEEMK